VGSDRLDELVERIPNSQARLCFDAEFVVGHCCVESDRLRWSTRRAEILLATNCERVCYST